MAGKWCMSTRLPAHDPDIVYAALKQKWEEDGRKHESEKGKSIMHASCNTLPECADCLSGWVRENLQTVTLQPPGKSVQLWEGV
jgi:hypothetical protein